MSKKRIELREGSMKSFFSLLAAGVAGYVLGKKTNVSLQSEDPAQIKKIEQILKQNKHKIRKIRKNTEDFRDMCQALEQGRIKSPKEWKKHGGWTKINIDDWD